MMREDAHAGSPARQASRHPHFLYGPVGRRVQDRANSFRARGPKITVGREATDRSV